MSIHPQNRNGKICGYRVSLGRGPDGKDRRKFFLTYAEAKAYEDADKNKELGTGELYQHRHELLFCLRRVKEVGSTLNQAVEFFIKHGAKIGNPTLANVITEFVEAKKLVERKPNYISGIEDKLSSFCEHIGRDSLIGDVTSKQIENYILVTRSDLSNSTKLDYLRAFSILFNFGIKKKYLSLNPTESVERPRIKFQAPKVLSVEDFTHLLNRCLRKKWHDRLTVFVLVGFCGIRTEEACKLKWADIDMQNKRVMVPADVAKKAGFRRNDIPANAMKWLALAHDKRVTGPVIGDNAKRQLNTAVRFAHIKYSQNCIRHSFCSYALEVGRPLAEVVSEMGHAGSPAMINAHYRNIVEPAAAKKWWQIVPKN